MYTSLNRMELEDCQRIKAALLKAGYEESNHNVVNLYMWENWYPIWLYEEENFLVLVGLHEGEYFIYMPLCTPDHFDEALRKARDLFDRNDVPFALSCFTEEPTNRALSIFPDLTATKKEEAFDYVYDAEKLRTLSGKKYQKRRNHYNAFMKEYGEKFEYHDLDERWIPDCLNLLAHWKLDDPDLFLRYEKDGSAYILENYDSFDCRGGVIVIDGKVEAFVVGSLLTEEMVQLNIMKANHEFRGLYQVIEREFLNRNYPDCLYVNKEDDAGNESLRKAKRSYNPIKMIEKYWISE